MQKVLIIGGAGYIGGFVTDLLIKNPDNQVTVYDNLTYETRYLKKVDFIYGNILDTEKLNGIIHDYDCIIWLAAIVGDGACAINPELTYQNNFESIKWLVDNYKGKIIFTSTCSVYGINNSLIAEDAVPNPLSVYASTKLKAEQYIIKNSNNYLIFRLGTLYGLSDNFSRLRLDLVANILTLKAVKGETLNVFGGEQWRPLLHVRDVAHAIEYCLKHDISGLYNLSECNLKISELAEIIRSHVPNAKVEYTDIKFEDLRNYRVKNDRIFATGWRPKENIHNGITEMIKIFRENRIKNFDDPIYSNAVFIKQLHEEGELCQLK